MPMDLTAAVDGMGQAGLRARPLDDDGTVVYKGKALLIMARSTAPRTEDHAKDSRCNGVTLGNPTQGKNWGRRHPTHDAMPANFPSHEQNRAELSMKPVGLHGGVSDRVINGIKSFGKVQLDDAGCRRS